MVPPGQTKAAPAPPMPTDVSLTIPAARRPRAVQDRDEPWRLAFLLSGLIPLLGLLWTPPQPTALFYSAYVATCYIRWVPLRGGAGFLFAALLTGALIETLHWMGDYLRCDAHQHLYHPQLLANLTLAFGFYGGMATAWIILFRRFSFSTSEAFVINGIMGVAVAHQGEILMMGMRTLPAGAMVWLYIYGLFGCMVAIPRRLSSPCRRKVARRWWHYPLALAACTSGAVGGMYGWAWFADLQQAIPAARPICNAPLW
ncbi:hypothetical protein DYI42_19860 [Vannielia litorea]|nr:hypothetical protein [Vannielia litorea]